uniref:BTB domain-containing protein n=1 Tax=Strongyloides papillosus TaxID=174720 RepID=A0A0N5BNA5_STREA
MVNLSMNYGSYKTQTRINKFSYVYSIENFPLRSEKKCEKIISQKCVIGSENISEWCLWVYPNGSNEWTEGYVSVHLRLEKPSKAKAKFRFCILNDKEEERYFKFVAEPHEFDKDKEWGFSKFVKRDLLLDESNGLLINGDLKILCVVEIIDFKEENHDSTKTSIDNIVPQSCLSLDFIKMLYSTKAFSDCTIKVGNTKNKAHKIILAAQSPLFHKIFNNPLKKPNTDVIEIKYFRVEVVKEMLKYIYTGEISDMQSMASELLEIAVKYKLDKLKEISERFLCGTLDIENVCKRFALSEKLSIESLKECCLELILENKEWITKTDEWKKFVSSTFTIS